MHLPRELQNFLTLLVLPILLVGIVLSVYYGSIPVKYELKTGDASPFDVTATRSIRDKTETDRRAERAAAEVSDVMLRSESISNSVLSKVDQFFAIIDNNRTLAAQTASGDPPALTAAQLAGLVKNLTTQFDDKLAIILPVSDLEKLVSLEATRFERLRGQIKTIATLIMNDSVDDTAIQVALSNRIQNLAGSMDFYQEDATIIRDSLSVLLRANVVFDATATDNARQAAYDKVQNNPVMINRGTRIVSQGDIITSESYALLGELDLIDDGTFDFQYLLGVVVLMSILMFVGYFYLKKYEGSFIHVQGDRTALVLALLIPLFVSTWLARNSPLTPPVYFAAVLISAYFGFRTAAVMSVLLTVAILPMTGFDPIFAMVALCGSIVAALFTKGISRRDNYAYIILATAGTCLVTTLAFGVLQKEDWETITLNTAYTALSGTLSVIAAIGVMPLFEMMFNAVSPIRLIELSQPGHPLLRRLFIEAPGSSQHSMMVANLADAAADAIGANPLLARVGAYYHDIGKLENPLMFTENQSGENPHDQLPPEKSAEIILGHPEGGVRIGRRYRLPPAILRIIHEHHGSTAQIYFYHKARKIAEESGAPEPDPAAFKYHCPLPSSRESAVVMLADTVEAAMKSTNTTRLNDAEVLIRRLIKNKNEQDQLINSNLSFKDIETIIKAFMQVYAGHFHERVKYPEDRAVRKPAT